MKDQVVEKARQIAEPILLQEGLELVDVYYGREGGRWVLRLFIDRADGTAGVGLDECQRGSQAVETALDVADIIPHEYALEVSTPGIERPLTRPEHFKRFVGRKVQVKTYGPLFDPPRKNFSGMLVSFSDEGAEVEVEGAGRFRIPFDQIAKAHLEAVWD